MIYGIKNNGSRLSESHFECFDYVAVERGAREVLQFFECFLFCFAPVLGARVDEAVVVVCDGDDACAERDVYAFEPFGIACSVPSFVMMEDIRNERLASGDVFHHGDTCTTVVFERAVFALREIRRFCQDEIRYGDVTDIMEKCGCLDEGYLFGRQAHLGCDACAVIGDLMRVAIQVGAFHL